MEGWRKYLEEQLSAADLKRINLNSAEMSNKLARMKRGPTKEMQRKLKAAGLDSMEYDQWLETDQYDDLEEAGQSPDEEKRGLAQATAAQRAENSLNALVRWKQTPISKWPTEEEEQTGKIKMTANINGKMFSWEGQAGDPKAPYWVKNSHRPWLEGKPTKKVTIPLNQYPEEIRDNIETNLEQILTDKAYSKAKAPTAKAKASPAPTQTAQDKASPAPTQTAQDKASPAPTQDKASPAAPQDKASPAPAPAQAAGPFAGDPSIKAWDKKWKGNPVADLSDDQEIMALKGRSRFRAAFKKARSAKAKFFHVPGFKYKVFNTGLAKK